MSDCIENISKEWKSKREGERPIHWIFLFCTFFYSANKNASHTRALNVPIHVWAGLKNVSQRGWAELRWVKSDNNKICASFKWITGKNWQWQSRTWFIRLKDQMNGNTLVRSFIHSFTLSVSCAYICAIDHERIHLCVRIYVHGIISTTAFNGRWKSA